MTQATIAALVEQHTCAVFNVRYSLKLLWADGEQHGGPASSSYLLRIRFSALDETTKAPMQMSLLVCLTQLSDLPAVIDQALRRALFEDAITTRPARPWAGAFQRCRAMWQRQADTLRMV